MPNLIVVPQFSVWIIEHNDQLEGTDDGDDPEEVEDLEKTAQGEHTVAEGMQVLDNNINDEDHEPEVGEGDISFRSTLLKKDARSVLMDFTIVHLTAVSQPEEKYISLWRVTNNCSKCLPSCGSEKVCEQESER
ncbi:uncharacterized protein F5891DRAFT_1193916 [Suillus fuscotomentosus]|uniref:Uncharacterized protein n=1 Tax=Suillus fuscotomentosus TaxID=1912939 RepID=A0AAD4DX40_9AGAM|nr:uncharacterized protein F5891DRAFT_1193916 [Suillus fuscotomentosus]KAG1895731.1 hypothetical protein F5891DRAFT_1193916 [Suillus fuscotomentosus]